jgi:cobyrinic acid a,c-diamide synthase
MSANIPRVVIAGMGGDSGKTLVSCGLTALCRRLNMNPVAYKKGPDYIDAAWLKLASQRNCSNLDTYMIGIENSKQIFFRNAVNSDIAIIEGNRGLYDGADSSGTHSTAEMAKHLGSNVILVINGTKVTRTMAAIVLGCKLMDSSLKIGGVILNNVSSIRHANVAVDAIENITGIKVIGVIKRYKNITLLPSRHLGLVTPAEHEQAIEAISNSADIIAESIDMNKFFEIANDFDDVQFSFHDIPAISEQKVKIGYFKDRVFSFYYPENLEALEIAGAEMVALSALSDKNLNNLDGLYIGGGFPETNLNQLSENKSMMDAVKNESDKGMPIYAECGGLMYLSQRIGWGSQVSNMCGVLPFDILMNEKPQGHGYVEAVVDKVNPFFTPGTKLIGHEFHYSSIDNVGQELNPVLSVERGNGAVGKRDGVLVNNTFASYMHIHACSALDWAVNFVRIAENYRKNK